jgi:hypothetical protein
MEDYRWSEYQHIYSAVARSGGEQDYNPTSPRRLTRRCSQPLAVVLPRFTL